MLNEKDWESLPILDPNDALEALGDKTVFGIMIDGLGSCLMKHLTEVKVSLEANEYDALKTQLQSLKGATLYTRCYRLSKAVEIFKASIDAAQYQNIPSNYARFMRESILLRRYLRRYICQRDGMTKPYN